MRLLVSWLNAPNSSIIWSRPLELYCLVPDYSMSIGGCSPPLIIKCIFSGSLLRLKNILYELIIYILIFYVCLI